MKILILFLCAFSFVLSANSSSKLPEPKEEIIYKNNDKNDSFFLVDHEFLILPPSIYVQFLNKKEKWQKVSSELFEGIGIKKGTDIKWVNFSTGEMKSYKVGAEVFIVTLHDNMTDMDRAAYLLLKDDYKDVKIRGTDGGDSYDSIAYTGTEYKLKSFSPLEKTLEEIKELNLKDPMVKKIVGLHNQNMSSNFSSERSYLSKYKGSEIYQIFGKTTGEGYANPIPGNGLVLKFDGKLYDIGDSWTDSDYSASTISFKTQYFLEGPDWVFSVNEQGMHSCFKIYILKDKTIKEISLYCDSGGC